MNTDARGSARDGLTQAVIGAAYEVANKLGHGFLEAVYRRALKHELGLAGLSVAEEVGYRILYKGEVVGTYAADLVVADELILELKAVEALAPAHTGQLLNYLRASGLKTGLLINFGTPKVEIRRISAP